MVPLSIGIEPQTLSRKIGLPAFAVVTLRRIHFVQQRFGLLDPAVDKTLDDLPRYCEFA